MDMGFIDSHPFGARDSDNALRPLGWSDLCARLLAAQAARRVLGKDYGADVARPDGLSGGSFHYPSAIMMLQPLSDDESAVNPISSVNGKGDCCMDSGQAKAPGDVADRVLTRRELP
ncbi:hypothetical protein [Novosphingobium sp. Chol11]|uniref:hypothetical protein n=1 Tax=Novosphingobium sp. Chol11 TaxID=1385763 RepID=UPI0025FD943F|nr:hypothetical protein [Novosphingobium sp. Chol11]